MASYLVVKHGEECKSFKCHTTNTSPNYLKVNGSYINLVTDTQTGVRLNVKVKNKTYYVQNSYTTTGIVETTTAYNGILSQESTSAYSGISTRESTSGYSGYSSSDEIYGLSGYTNSTTGYSGYGLLTKSASASWTGELVSGSTSWTIQFNSLFRAVVSSLVASGWSSGTTGGPMVVYSTFNTVGNSITGNLGIYSNSQTGKYPYIVSGCDYVYEIVSINNHDFFGQHTWSGSNTIKSLYTSTNSNNMSSVTMLAKAVLTSFNITDANTSKISSGTNLYTSKPYIVVSTISNGLSSITNLTAKSNYYEVSTDIGEMSEVTELTRSSFYETSSSNIGNMSSVTALTTTTMTTVTSD